jgi:hypothetical protein
MCWYASKNGFNGYTWRRGDRRVDLPQFGVRA